MARQRKNVQRTGLSKVEREEFESVGYTDEAIAKFEEHLKLPRWDFWSKSSELFITLRGIQETIMVSGKYRTQDITSSAKFTSNYYSTADREIARLIFLSDLYQIKKIKLVQDQVEDDAQAVYNEFKNKILSSKENVEKLKRDLVSAGA